MAASDSNVPQRQLQLSNQPPPKKRGLSRTQRRASFASPSASTASAAAFSYKSLPAHLTHKSRLHEFARRAGISTPVYQTLDEGNKRGPPVFRSAVLVSGVSYTSPNTFGRRKAAEQDAARLAMINLTEKIKDEVLPIPPIHEDLVFCKSILNDYTTKRKMEPPTYHTFQGSTKVPFFVSSLVFNGVSYTGDVAKSKKEAEQLVARAVVQSLLGDSESAPLMLETLRSRCKLVHESKKPDSSLASLATSAVNTGQSYVISTDTSIAAAPEASLGMHPPRHEFIKRKQEEPASQETPLLHEDLVFFCKIILNDYKTKRKMEPPTYRTFQGSMKVTNVPIFVSSLVFNGVSYTGDVAKSKKEAEQLAARAVVQSLLGDSESAPLMLEILRSKYKLVHKSKKPDCSHASLATSAVNTGQSYVISTDTSIAAAPEASLGLHPPRRESIKRKQEEPASQETPPLPTTCVPSVCEQPLGVVSTSLATAPTSLVAAPTSLALAPTSLAAGPTSLAPAPTSLGVSPTSCAVLPASKKRRKNRKAEMNLQNDAQLAVGTLNLNQPASCSVSQ